MPTLRKTTGTACFVNLAQCKEAAEPCPTTYYMNRSLRLTCRGCPVRATCTSVCADISRQLPAADRGRIAGLQRRMALLYGERLEARRRYVRFLLDWRHVLSPQARAVFDLRYNNGLSLAEIGHKMGISSHSVSRNLRQSYRVIERAAKAARKP